MISYRYMRIIVIFDLPVKNKKERRIATWFRKALLDDGFDMLQYSVYSRLCANRDDAHKHLERVKREAPKTGSIRLLMLTERQFTEMYVIAGEKTAQEQLNIPTQLVFF